MTTAVTADAVRSLREATGAGIMDCKEALAASGGDFERAKDYLRRKGLAAAARRSDRVASEGTVAAYVHLGRIGTLVEVRCETDFVGRTAEFQSFARAVAMHVAAQAPRWLRRDEVPPEIVERERETLRAEAAASGKPPGVVEKIAAGRLEKFFAQTCLLDQTLVVPVDGVESHATVGDAVKALSARVGEKVEIARFVRLVLGEDA